MKRIRKNTTLSIKEAQRLVGADAPIPVRGLPNDLVGLKGLASITRSRLVSRGGRPSDPSWTVSRKVPMKPETWSRLDQYAQRLQKQAIRISAGQIAAIALERGIEVTIDESTQEVVIKEGATFEYAFSSEACVRAHQMKQPMLQYGIW